MRGEDPGAGRGPTPGGDAPGGDAPGGDAAGGDAAGADTAGGDAPGPPLSRAILVRHGQTEWSRTHRHTGTTDLPLEPAGQAQARRLAPVLAGIPFARVLTSPMQRARETCRLAGLSRHAEICPDLDEWNYGHYEGRTTDEIHRERPGWSLWTDGAPGGETPSQVAARADRVVAAIRATSGDVAVFSHGHFLRILAVRWVGLPPAEGPHVVLDPGRVSRLAWEHGQPALDLWNAPPELGLGEG